MKKAKCTLAFRQISTLRKVGLLLTMMSILFTANSRKPVYDAPGSVEGRWDLTMTRDGQNFPSWLEIRHSGNRMLVGDFVFITGSARPVSRIFYQDGKIRFTLPPQWEEGDKDFMVEGTHHGDSLSGKLISSDNKQYSFTGTRAPSLYRESAPVWGAPIKLFNEKNLEGWHATGKNQWKAESGILRNPESGSNLVSDGLFSDFKLHIEFRYPKGSNSGIYLRGRYEVQVEDGKGSEPLKDLFGAVYGFIKPAEMAAKAPGEWQYYDITLTGRMVSIVANGKMIICSQEIPGITGGALDSQEGKPGPIMLQGDHGSVEFRNIIITPALN